MNFYVNARTQHSNMDEEMISVKQDKTKAAFQLLIFVTSILATIQLVQFLPAMMGFSQPYIPIAILLTLLTMLLSKTLLTRENQSLTDLSLYWAKDLWRNALCGIFLGGILFIFMIGTLILFTNLSYHIDETTNLISFLTISIPTLLILSIVEEVIFRGYFLFKLKTEFGIRTAIYVTAIIFGLYHGLSFEAAFGPFTFGLIFGLMALKSKGLILPIVFHFMLNWMQALFGMKEKYTSGMFELVFVGEPTFIEADKLGLAIHLLLLVAAIFAIEHHIKRRKNMES